MSSSAFSSPSPENQERSVNYRRFQSWVSKVRSFASTKSLRPALSWFRDRSASWCLSLQLRLGSLNPFLRKRRVSIIASNIVIKDAAIPNGVNLVTSGQVTIVNCTIGKPVSVSGNVIIGSNPPTAPVPVIDVPKVRREMPLVGYRYWRLTLDEQDRLLLRAQAQSCAWEPGPNEAVCMMGGDHAIPAANCTCGLYAYKALPTSRQGFDGLQIVIGAVLMWGRVLEHTDGYRAQYAHPIALIRDPWGITEAVARQVGIPVVDAEHLNTYLSEFGDIPPPPQLDKAED